MENIGGVNCWGLQDSGLPHPGGGVFFGGKLTELIGENPPASCGIFSQIPPWVF